MLRSKEAGTEHSQVLGQKLGEKLKNKILLKIVSACLCKELYHKTYFLSGTLSQSSLKTVDGNEKWKLCRKEVGESFWALSFCS
jgi:hypothetical protein